MTSPSTYEKYTEKICSLFDIDSVQKQIEEIRKKTYQALFKQLQELSKEKLSSAFNPSKSPKAIDIFLTEVPPKDEKIDNPLFDHVLMVLSNIKKNIRHQQIVLKEKKRDLRKDIAFCASDIDIKEELKILGKQYPYNNHKKAWKLPVFDLYSSKKNKTVSFSDLYFKLYFMNNQVQYAVKIIPGKNAIHSSRNLTFWHPHTSANGYLCFGEVEAAAQKMWKRKDLVGLLMIICAILNTYNSNSPYAKLEQFIAKEKYICQNCHKDLDEDCTVFVDDDKNLPACIDCVVWVTTDESPPVCKWAEDYRYSRIEEKWLLKTNSVVLVMQHGVEDYISNPLANPNINMCPRCYRYSQLIDMPEINNIKVCVDCYQKNQQAQQAKTHGE